MRLLQYFVQLLYKRSEEFGVFLQLDTLTEPINPSTFLGRHRGRQSTTRSENGLPSSALSRFDTFVGRK